MVVSVRCRPWSHPPTRESATETRTTTERMCKEGHGRTEGRTLSLPRVRMWVWGWARCRWRDVREIVVRMIA